MYVVDVVVPVDADLGTSSAEGLYPGATRWSASRLRPISPVSKSTEHNVSCIVIPSLIARRQTTCSEDSAGWTIHSLPLFLLYFALVEDLRVASSTLGDRLVRRGLQREDVRLKCEGIHELYG